MKFHAKIVEILVKIMERRQHLGIRASPSDLVALEASEKLCAQCIAKLSLSLHEAQMNVVFEKLTMWAQITVERTSRGEDDDDDDDDDEFDPVGSKRKRSRSADADTTDGLTLDRVWRSIPFYHTVCAIMEELRSMGSAYAWSVVPDILKMASARMPFAGTAPEEEAKVLKRARINSEGSISDSLSSHLNSHYAYLSVVLEAFRLTILHGSDRWDGGNASEFQRMVAVITRRSGARRSSTLSRPRSLLIFP